MYARRRKAAKSQPQRAAWQSALLSLPVTAAMALLLLVLSALLLLLTKDPARYHGAVGVVLLYVTAALGGAAAALLGGRRLPLQSGILSGASMFLLFSIPALFIPGGFHKLWGLALRLPIIAAAIGGAFLACRRRKVRRRR